MSAGDPDICEPSPSDVTAGNNKGEGSGGGWKKKDFFFSAALPAGSRAAAASFHQVSDGRVMSLLSSGRPDCALPEPGTPPTTTTTLHCPPLSHRVPHGATVAPDSSNRQDAGISQRSRKEFLGC